MIRELVIATLQTTLSLTDTESPQPVYVLAGVEAPAGMITTSERQSSESLADP
jgi:hypothetical protein